VKKHNILYVDSHCVTYAIVDLALDMLNNPNVYGTTYCMKCLYCGSTQSSVIDKRTVASTGEIRRRRECLKCHRRFTTYERVCAIELMVIKRDGRKEAYDVSKLKRGIERALEKRPVENQLDAVVARIEQKFFSKGVKEVDSKLLGQAVLAELKRLDDVAYLRFVSVYRHFTNAQDFTKELKHLKVEIV
jgi:transcriptional repressor NrdR